jgi:hypothetical protein
MPAAVKTSPKPEPMSPAPITAIRPGQAIDSDSVT